MWDMPITVEVSDQSASNKVIKDIFLYFKHIDDVFNTFRSDSEISLINQGKLSVKDASHEVKLVLALCELIKQQTNGFFEYRKGNIIDPLGIVKGWAVKNASDDLLLKGIKNFYIDAGGDIQIHGKDKNNKSWDVGIRNPFNRNEIIKKLVLTDCGIATSGNYIRGNHVINPHNPGVPITDIISLTVIGPDVLKADSIATAAYAMGIYGIEFIEKLPDFEGYQIDKNGNAMYTSHFDQYVSA